MTGGSLQRCTEMLVLSPLLCRRMGRSRSSCCWLHRTHETRSFHQKQSWKLLRVYSLGGWGGGCILNERHTLPGSPFMLQLSSRGGVEVLKWGRKLLKLTWVNFKEHKGVPEVSHMDPNTWSVQKKPKNIQPEWMFTQQQHSSALWLAAAELIYHSVSISLIGGRTRWYSASGWMNRWKTFFFWWLLFSDTTNTWQNGINH